MKNQWGVAIKLRKWSITTSWRQPASTCKFKSKRKRKSKCNSNGNHLLTIAHRLCGAALSSRCVIFFKIQSIHFTRSAKICEPSLASRGGSKELHVYTSGPVYFAHSSSNRRPLLWLIKYAPSDRLIQTPARSRKSVTFWRLKRLESRAEVHLMKMFGREKQANCAAKWEEQFKTN